MKNLELLDIIGEVNEDYVLAAGDNVVKPRFRWQTLAACAACAALVVAAYPAWQASRPDKCTTADSALSIEDAPEASRAPAGHPGLHEYTLVEGGADVTTTGGDLKAAAGGAAVAGQAVPEPAQENGPSGTYNGSGEDAGTADSTGPDAPAQGEALAQCERLLQSLGLLGGDAQGLYPEWCGGIWLDGERLTVAIVDGFHTRSLEQQILDWCGGTGEILFPSVKYSQNHLDGLMGEVARVLEELDCRLSSTYGVYVMDNYLGLDFFGGVPSDEVLAALAEIDPDGDAIFIQVFTDRHITPTDGSAKGPVPAPAADPTEPSVEARPTPAPADGPAAVAEPSVPPAP